MIISDASMGTLILLGIFNDKMYIVFVVVNS